MTPRDLRSRRTVRITSWLLAGAIAFAASADTPPPGPPPPLLFLDRVDVDLVDVEVFVTDRAGRRVTDLAREDFELFVDGQRVEITNFAAASLQTAVSGPPALAVSRADGPAGLSDRDLPAANEPFHLVVYVDEEYLHPANRRRALDALERFLEARRDREDQVMLLAFDGAVDVVQPFTEDLEALRGGLGTLRLRAARSGAHDLQFRQALRAVFDMPADEAEGFVMGYVQQAEHRVRQSAKGLADALRGLAGLPGRKALLYVSDGLEQRPGQVLLELLYGPQTGLLRSFQFDQRRAYDLVAKEANAQRVTLYTLDATGPRSGAFTTPDFPGMGNGAVGGDDLRIAMDVTDQMNHAEPALDLAHFTGGTAILNTLAFDRKLEELAVDFDSYYSLGFSSPAGGDGAYHRVEVQVRRPGARVRHRGGYVDKPPVERVADRARSLLELGLEGNPLGMEIGLGTPERKGRQWVVPLLVRVPAAGVALIPRNGELHGRLSFYVAVRDDRGRVSEVTRIPHEIMVPDRGTPGGDIGYGAQLKVRPGRSSLIVGVWDELGGRESYVRTEFSL